MNHHQAARGAARRRCAIQCLALAVLAGAPAAAADLAQRIDASIAPSFTPDMPGAAIIVTRDGKAIFRKAYGSADLDAKLALDPGMAMRVGSITKQFTATAILILAEQGKLSLHDDIRTCLPAFPDKGKPITIEHLLTHTSGIRNYTDDPGFVAAMARDLSVTQLIATFKDAPLAFAPGERFAYSNSGYVLLGAIIEKVSGMRYADFVAQRIFEPLGMRHTAYDGYERSKVVHARGYRGGAGKFVAGAPVSMSQPFAAGALVSTVDDLARWDAAITAGRLLGRASWKQAFTAYTLNNGASSGYGYGWGIGRLQGSTAIVHGGGISGFSAFAMRLPDENVYVAVLSNSDSGLVESELLAHRAAGIAIGKPIPEPQAAPPTRTALRLAPGVFERYVGRYELAPGFVIDVMQDGEKYIARASGEEAQEIFALSDVLFYSRTVEAQLRFEPQADGSVARLFLLQSGRETPGKRLR